MEFLMLIIDHVIWLIDYVLQNEGNPNSKKGKLRMANVLVNYECF